MSKQIYEAIVSYMDDEIRENLHYDIAPCTESVFLNEYIRLVPSFYDFIINEGFISKSDLDEFLEGD